MPPTIGDYYRRALEEATKEIDATSDDRVLGMDPEEWISYLDRKWGMVEIEFDDAREVEMVEVETEYRQRDYDIYSDQEPGTVIRRVAVRVDVPVVPSDTLEVIAQRKLAPNSFSISHGYPPFDYNHGLGILSVVAQPQKADIDRELYVVRSTVAGYNTSIQSEQTGFKNRVSQLVGSKRDRVAQKHKHLDDLAAQVGIPLRKKADVTKIVPTAPRVRATVAPIIPTPRSKPATRPILEADKFNAILELIDNSGRQFERTPQAFQQLTEEGLRDIILGSLNAVFEGAAGGETFQGIGKVDIHLRISQGEVFVAELKFWNGPESLRHVVEQLRGRLSWRDGYGVALLLSRNAGFTDVLKSIRNILPTCEGFAGNVRAIGQNHIAARFTIPSDTARQANIHVLAYNLHVPAPGGRITKSNAR